MQEKNTGEKYRRKIQEKNTGENTEGNTTGTEKHKRKVQREVQEKGTKRKNRALELGMLLTWTAIRIVGMMSDGRVWPWWRCGSSPSALAMMTDAAALAAEAEEGMLLGPRQGVGRFVGWAAAGGRAG